MSEGLVLAETPTGRPVEPAPGRLVVEGVVVEGQKNASVSLNINEKSDIRQGILRRRLAEIRAGNQAWMV